MQQFSQTLIREGGGKEPLLSLVCIFALACSSQTAWVVNKSDSQQGTQHIDTTISSDIALESKSTAIYTDRSNPIENLAIDSGVTVQVNKNNGKGIEINTGSNGIVANNITNNGHINTRGTGISINGRSNAETITIGANGSVTSASGNAIYIGNSSRVNYIGIQDAITRSGGIINHGTIGVQTTTQPNGIKVTGSIAPTDNRAIILANHGTIHGGINIENGGTLTGGGQGVSNALRIAIHNNGGAINRGIEMDEGSILNGGIMSYASYYGGFSRLNGNIEVAGAINGTNIGIQNSFGTVSGGVKVTDKGKVTGSIWNQDTIEGKIEIKGKVDGLIANRPTGVIRKDIEASGGIITDDISSWGTIEASIKVENDANITGDIYNEKTIRDNIDIANSQTGGSIVNSGINANTGNISITGTSDVKGSIVNQNGATSNGQITLEQDSRLRGTSNAQGSTMSGQLNLSGEIGATDNAGKFNSTLILSSKVGEINNIEGRTIDNGITINNGRSVEAINSAGTMQSITNNGTLSNITNSGTMQAITNNATTGTLTLTNDGGTIDKITNGTGTTATIRNQGEVTNGIINDGGTLTIFSDFRRGESIANGYHTIGGIDRTANGIHIENNNGGKLHPNIWYFNKKDYATSGERKSNALLVNENYARITIGDSFVSIQGLDVDRTYNTNTLIIGKDGNAVGDRINDGQGINVNKLHSVSGIYKFENFGGKGEYRAITNRDELSGKTLAQSIVYSQRMRNIDLSRIFRGATAQVFVSGKEGGANGKNLGQSEQLYTNRKGQNSQSHTFVIPYCQNFSADLGNNAKLGSNSSGILITTQRELPNDYGVLGIYTGLEDAEQEVNAQRLDLNGNPYYAGLTYNRSFHEDDLTTYFMNLTTKLGYIERDVIKTYLGYTGSVSSTIKIFGYEANTRMGLSHYLRNDAKITPQMGFNYLGMRFKLSTLNHLGDIREHYYSQNFDFIDVVATIKCETPWVNRFKASLALGTIISVYKDAEGTLRLSNNFLSSELDITRLYGIVQGGVSYDLTKGSDIFLGYSGVFSSASTIRSHAFMFKYAWWW